MRRNFFEIVKESKMNIRAEYERIYELYNSDEYSNVSIIDLANEYFWEFDKEFRGRAISMDDFDNTYGFYFSPHGKLVTVEKLITYCEYVVNVINQIIKNVPTLGTKEKNLIKYIRQNVDACMDEISHVAAIRDEFIIYVGKDEGAIAVSEIVPKEIAYSVLEYNHFRLKGDLTRKREILKMMADNIEGKSVRDKLKTINSKLESQLYQLLNKFVRHDHSVTPYIGNMSSTEIENTYDDIYQLWLLAKLELDNVDRKERMTDLLNKCNDKSSVGDTK